MSIRASLCRSVALAGLLGLLSGCAPANIPLTRFRESYVGYLDTVVNLTAYCADAQTFYRLSASVEEELARLSLLFDIYRSDSPLARLNACAGQMPAEDTPAEICELFTWCREMQKTTGGVNVAMGAVLSLWHAARETGIPPEEAAIRQAMKHVSPEAVILLDNRLFLRDAEQSLDFGAVAKGYVAQKLAALIRESGVDIFLLDCGTSTLVCAGKPPDKTGWQVAVRNPDASLNLSDDPQPAQTLGTLSLTDRCVGVSGDYQKYFLAGGTYYAHILSPDTGQPAAWYRMVCVLTDTPTEADYYSTALFALPYDEARQAAEKAPGLEALWIFADGSRRATDGFPSLEV